jgi:lipoprotein NlpD
VRLAHWLCILLLTGCATGQKAPVIERAPQTKTQTQTPTKKIPSTPEKDWRPDVYVVKKGDTLYGIGLEYGYDYKEIAQWNNIPPPYRIYVGQTLKLKEPKAAPAPDAASAATSAVTVAPLKSEPPPAPRPVDEPPLLTEPKAIKEPYTELALTAPPATAAAEQAPKAAEPMPKAESSKPTEPPKAETTPKTEAPPAEKPASAAPNDEAVDWGWPAQGKVIAGFGEANGSKGMDIAGTLGQPVLAAASGKVVYSGSGLRGYGKLVIIKHNKTYLSAYAHNSQILVKEGQEVTKGQKIAEMGNTDSDRVKLHFEIRRLGKPVDPAKLLPEKP